MKKKSPIQVSELNESKKLLESVRAGLLMAGEPTLSMAASSLAKRVESALEAARVGAYGEVL